MKQSLFRFLSFAFMLGLLLVALKVVNWLPLALRQDAVRRYATLEEARAALNIRDLLVPSYFPQSISWPPAVILAQSKPYTAIAMEFTRADKRNTALIISQSEGKTLTAAGPIQLRSVSERVRYPIKGREAALTVGFCANDEPCSGLTWTEGKYTMTVLMKASPFELTKIVESMLH